MQVNDFNAKVQNGCDATPVFADLCTSPGVLD